MHGPGEIHGRSNTAQAALANIINSNKDTIFRRKRKVLAIGEDIPAKAAN